MTLEDKEKLLRVYVLGVLVAHSGKQLVPDLVGELTSELVARAMEVIEKEEEFK